MSWITSFWNKITGKQPKIKIAVPSAQTEAPVEALKDPSERRTAVRYKVSTPVVFRVLTGAKKWVGAQSMDISSTGPRLFTQEHLPVGTKLELEVTIPKTGKKIRTSGQIVWTKSKEILNECLFFVASVKMKQIYDDKNPFVS